MAKQLKKILPIASITLILFIAYRLRVMPTQIRPYPYLVGPQWSKQLEQEAKKAEQSHILLLGDKMGERLAQYLPQVVEAFKGKLKEPLTIMDWTGKQEGLHRSIIKLKHLKRLPPIIIYHGGSEELIEAKFRAEDIPSINQNFDTFKNDLKASLIMVFPILSKFLYRPVKFFQLSQEIIVTNQDSSAMTLQQKHELEFKLYEFELEEMIERIKENKSKLFLISVPVKLDLPPKRVCENTITSELDQLHTNISKQIQANASIDIQALQEANAFVPGNAKTLFLLGVAMMNKGEISSAKEYFYQAVAYDCVNHRINPVFNLIMEKTAKTHGQDFIDFDKMVNNSFGENILFLNDDFPQDIFYQRLVDELIFKLKTYLQL